MYRKISYPSLLLITNSHESQWYRVTTANHMEKLDALVDEKAQFSDKEGGRAGSFASGGNLKTNEEWNEETQKHIKKAAEKTRELWKSEKFEDLVISAPENLKNKITEELNLPHVEHFYIPGNFTHENLHQKLLERIDEGVE